MTSGDVRFGTKAGRWVLVATIVGSGMAALDATVVNVALPAIGKDLGAELSGLQWVVTGYLLSLASLILLGGALGDRYGRRRVFLIGVAGFRRHPACARDLRSGGPRTPRFRRRRTGRRRLGGRHLLIDRGRGQPDHRRDGGTRHRCAGCVRHGRAAGGAPDASPVNVLVA